MQHARKMLNGSVNYPQYDCSIVSMESDRACFRLRRNRARRAAI